MLGNQRIVREHNVVNLYFSEIFDTTSVVGGRVFDVYIENDLVLDDYDAYAAAGNAEDTGIMESFVVELADDYITIEFDHLTQNPAIKAIEILAAAEEVADSSLANGASLTTDTEGDDGATPSDTVETTITMPSSGGPQRRHLGGPDQRAGIDRSGSHRPAVRHHDHPGGPRRRRPVRDPVRARRIDPPG